MQSHDQQEITRAYALAVLHKNSVHEFCTARQKGPSARCVEVPWCAKVLAEHQPARLLDVGFTFSPREYFDVLLAYNEQGGVINGLDIIEPQRVVSRYHDDIVKKVFSIPVIVADIRSWNSPKAEYDMVTCISVIEHIGFDEASPAGTAGTAFKRATTAEDVCKTRAPNTDTQVLSVIREVLKPGGLFVLTVPMGDGRPAVLRDSLGYFCAQHEYSLEQWNSLTRFPGFDLVEEHLFTLTPDGYWEQADSLTPVTRKDGPDHGEALGCACALLRKAG